MPVRRNRRTAIVCLATTLNAAAALAAEQGCEAYSTYSRLPPRFTEIASGELSAGPGRVGTIEFFLLSDGICTCTSVPAGIHGATAGAGRPPSWNCRAARDDEKPTRGR